MKKMRMIGVLFFVVFLSPGALRAQDAAAESAVTVSGAAIATGAARQAGQEGQALPEVRTYDELRHAISEARAESRLRVEKAAEQERVREAWEIGKLIDAHVLQHKERADYAGHVLERLAGDLGMSRTELYRMLKFYRAYPIVAAPQQLSWAHYRELLSVNDPKEREAIAAEAVKNKWSQKELRQAIRKVRSEKGTPEEDSSETQELLPPSAPGKPGTYRVIRAKAGPFGGELALDLGFSNYVNLSSVILKQKADTLKEGDIVTFDAPSPFQRPATLRHKALADRRVFPGQSPDDLYTYEAYVYKIQDGDTVTAVVDLGFGITTTQTLRLRGIDAPEIVTADGVEAKRALEKMIGKTSPILVKTVKSDKYDRYLADVFVNGVYGNQKLVDDGYAVPILIN